MSLLLDSALLQMAELCRSAVSDGARSIAQGYPYAVFVAVPLRGSIQHSSLLLNMVSLAITYEVRYISLATSGSYNV